MKKIALVLASTFFMIGGNSLQAQEMPLSVGVKGGLFTPYFTNLDKAKGSWGSASEANPFNLSYNVGLFGEYAFHDYVGVGLDALYARNTVQVNKKGDGKTNIETTIHQANVGLMAKFYPMGRDIDEGVLNIHVGPEFIIPFLASYTDSGKNATDIPGDQLNKFNMGGLLGVGYDFPFGLLVELRGGYAFLNDVFTDNSAFKTSTLKVDKAEKLNPFYGNLSVGYNFMRLLED